MGKNNIFFVFEYSLLFEELSHRSSAFAKIIQDAEQDIRDIL
jgi:phosphoserine aminotransferase